MKQKLIMIFTVTAIAVLCASVFAGCGEGDKNSEATTTPSSTAVQPTTAKSTLPKNTAPTGVNGASSQASAYNPAAEPDNNNDPIIRKPSQALTITSTARQTRVCSRALRKTAAATTITTATKIVTITIIIPNIPKFPVRVRLLFTATKIM